MPGKRPQLNILQINTSIKDYKYDLGEPNYILEAYYNGQLIVSREGKQGFLLPQVPVDHDRNWDVQTFLEHTCEKAWLPRNAWKDVKNTKVEHFTATIFEEKSPKGEIRQKKIGE